LKRRRGERMVGDDRGFQRRAGCPDWSGPCIKEAEAAGKKKRGEWRRMCVQNFSRACVFFLSRQSGRA
jgi:hypothetical protein